MRRSEQINEIVAALCKAKAEYPKMGKNAMGHYPFADLHYMMDCVQPALTKYGLDITHQPDVLDGKEVLCSVITHISGQWMESLILLRASDNKSTSYGSALTYMKRYAASALLGINPKDDPTDNDGVSDLVSPDQVKKLEDALADRPDLKTRVLASYKVTELKHIYKGEYDELMRGIQQAKMVAK